MPTARAAYGVALLAAPGGALRLCGVRRASAAGRAVVRLLGARELIQALLLHPGSRAGVAIDTAHGLSMLGLAAVDRDVRRPAMVSAAAAAALIASAHPFAPTAAAATPAASPAAATPSALRR